MTEGRAPLRAAALGALLLTALLGRAPGPAWADDATIRNLLERGSASLEEAQRLYFRGEAPAAQTPATRAMLLFEQAEAQRRGDPEAVFLLIQAAVFAGDETAARRWLELYATRSAYRERDPNLHYARALVLLLLEGRSAAAVASLEEMHRVAPRLRERTRDTLYFAALSQEGQRLLQGKRPLEAVAVLRKAAQTALGLGDRRKLLVARSNVGIALHLGKQYEQARQVFQRLTEEEPQSSVWPFYLGWTLAELARYDEAVAAYERVTKGLEAGQVPANMLATLQEAWLHIGAAQRALAERAQDPAVRRSHAEKAHAALTAYAGRAPQDARGHFALGALRVEVLDRPYEALAPLETAHALDPVCDAALALLIAIATDHPAPEGVTDWSARRTAWEQDYATNREARARERKVRALQSLDGSDGCR